MTQETTKLLAGRTYALVRDDDVLMVYLHQKNGTYFFLPLTHHPFWSDDEGAIGFLGCPTLYVPTETQLKKLLNTTSGLVIDEMVNENPNDQELGQHVRSYVKSNNE